jgi:hypothetical protein
MVTALACSGWKTAIVGVAAAVPMSVFPAGYQRYRGRDGRRTHPGQRHGVQLGADWMEAPQIAIRPLLSW